MLAATETKPEPITLNVADVIAAAKAAYLEGRLSAQGPTPACEYRDKSGLPCAIGVAISDELAAAWVRYSVYGLVHAGLLKSDHWRSLQVIQDAHDAWAHHPEDDERRKAFVARLGLESAQ